MSRLLLRVLLIAAAGAGGFWAYRALVGSQGTPAPVTPAAADVTPPEEAVAAPAARKIPEVLPEVELHDREGRVRTLRDWGDRPLLINFWATWCAPCRREIPLLKRLRAERREQGLEVVGIAVDVREAVLEYAREIGLDYPLLIGEQEGFEAAAAFGMDLVLPFSVFADRAGRIVTVKVGELHADEAAYILDTVAELDARRLDMAQARSRIAARLKTLAAARATGAT
jgi:thiol-disulfide isomerase/thioredoxin